MNLYSLQQLYLSSLGSLFSHRTFSQAILGLFLLPMLMFTSCESDHAGDVQNKQFVISSAADTDIPDMVVGIIIDQLRPDYIYRYWDQYGDNGFRRLVREGYTFRNAWFSYLQTSTGPGHAAQLTGATPDIHGLIGNRWYDRELDRHLNIIEDVDSGYRGVGSLPDYNGEKSPANMLTTTVGDELFLHTNERSRTIGISRKDRGAILPAGHAGYAYWYEPATGNFITSTYYHEELPEWLREFNDRNLAQEFLTRVWEPLLPKEDYTGSREDDNPYEGTFRGMDSPTFPIDLFWLVEEHNHGPEILSRTTFSDELLIELAIAAMKGEELGRRDVPDILSISLSATDAIGHRFGPASKQMHDHLLRLDQYLARLLDYLDEQYGKEKILVFLTSDHGATYIPHYLRDRRIITGNPDTKSHIGNEIRDAIIEYMEYRYGEDILLAYSNQNLYLDHEYIARNNLDLTEVRTDIKRFVLTLDPVAGALTADALNNTQFTSGIRARAQRMFHQKRSGDVLLWLQAQTLGNTGTGGTSHGTPWTYDTHAPLIFYGFKVPPGQSTERVYVSDIASTVSIYLNSPFPSGNIGNPLNDLMRP